MIVVRRWYIYLVSVVSLQAVTWAIIYLLQNLLTPGFTAEIESIAFQIAVIIIGLPMFLVHWLWAQRLAGRDPDERQSTVRWLYLYATLAIFLIPFIVNTFDLFETVLRLLLGRVDSDPFSQISPSEAIIQAFIALAVLALLWFYHWRVIVEDRQAGPETEQAATVRRLYIFGFSALGLVLTSLALIHLLRWLMFQFGQESVIGGQDISTLATEMAMLLVGLPLWLIFWRWAQVLFFGPNEAERESVLRKFYLYLVIFISVLGTVTNAAFILAGLFRRLLDLPPTGDIRDPLPIIIGMSLLWAYHAYVLKDDVNLTPEAPRQAGVRRLYLYLVAAIGLAAFLVGLSSDISVLIRALVEESFASDLKEQLAWSTAALLAGLPVWLWPWRLAQLKAVAPGPEGAEARQSLVRKIYLYFYLFVATMTVLSSAIYIVFQLLSLALGGRNAENLLSDLGHALAFGLIAVGVWLYHGLALRGDGRLNQHDQAARLAGWRVALVDKGEGEFGRAALDRLRRELPDLSFELIGLTEQAAQAMGATTAQGSLTARLAGVQLIVGPWDMTVEGIEGNGISLEIARAIIASPARKLLVPVRAAGWEWAGVDHWSAENLVQQTVHAVKQIVSGEEVKPARGLSLGAMIGIVAGLFFLLIFLIIPVLSFLSF